MIGYMIFTSEVSFMVRYIKSDSNVQPKFSQGYGDNYVLGKIPRKLLMEGNKAAFAEQLLLAHPEFCDEQGFDDIAAINKYKAYIDYNDGIFTFYGKGKWSGAIIPIKYLFDTEMNLVGTKI